MARRGRPAATPPEVSTPGLEGPILLAVAIATLTTHVLGVVYPGALWGANAYRFLPWPSLVVVGLATSALVVWVVGSLRVAGAVSEGLQRHHAWSGWRLAGVVAASTLGVAALFWSFRARHVFLGDGLILVTSLAHTSQIHPLEPLGFLLERASYLLVSTQGWAAGMPPLAPGLEPFVAAWLAAALVSVAAGVVFFPIAVGVAGTLRSLAGSSPAASGAPARADVLVLALLTACLVGQGFVALFFGYIEVYSTYTAGAALYLWLALRFLLRHGPLWQAAAALALAVGLHLSALVLAPSLLVLAGIRFARRAEQPGMAFDMALSMGCFAVVAVGLFALGGGYNVVGTMIHTLRQILAGEPGARGYLLSGVHLRDFSNGALLAGPLGLLFFVVAALAFVRKGRLNPATVFLLACGLGPLAGAWIAGDSNLGYARNWDLLAPTALPMTVAGLGLLMMRMSDLRRTRLVLGGLVAVSVFHTLPWVAVNASLERSRERFALLPLGLGRVESTLGLWEGIQGNLDGAEVWFNRALEANPGNLRAILFLGRVHMQEQRYAMATRAYERALQFRPERDDYGIMLAGALFMDGQLTRTAWVIDRLIARNPADAVRHALHAIVLKAEGNMAGAERAIREALRLEPSNVTLLAVAGSLSYRGDRGALREAWRLLVDLPL